MRPQLPQQRLRTEQPRRPLAPLRLARKQAILLRQQRPTLHVHPLQLAFHIRQVLALAPQVHQRRRYTLTLPQIVGLGACLRQQPLAHPLQHRAGLPAEGQDIRPHASSISLARRRTCPRVQA